MAEEYSIVCVSTHMCVCVCIYIYVFRIFFIHLSICGYLDFFQVLNIVNNATVNMWVQICFRNSDFISFRYIPRSGIVGSHGSSVFNILRHLHISFHNDWTNLPPHQQCTRVPFWPHPHQHLLSLIFLVIAILKGVKFYSKNYVLSPTNLGSSSFSVLSLCLFILFKGFSRQEY